MRNGTCIPCQYGNHRDHYRVIQAVAPGVMGGAQCLCRGECQPDAGAVRLKLQPLIDLMRGRNR